MKFYTNQNSSDFAISNEPLYFSSLSTFKQEGISQFTYASISRTDSVRLGGNLLRYWFKIDLGLLVLGLLRYMSPQRLMVAGVRLWRLSVSNKRQVFESILRTSPLGKLILLFSSRSEFRFSAQSWSMGPSKWIHFFKEDFSSENSRSFWMNRPSFQAPLSEKTSPINSDFEIDLGLILYSFTPLKTNSYSKAKIWSISSFVFA